MEKKSPERTKPKTPKVRCNLNAPKPKRVCQAGDLNGCVLVIPEFLGTKGPARFTQGGLKGITFKPEM
jgi:hypothetical protein